MSENRPAYGDENTEIEIDLRAEFDRIAIMFASEFGEAGVSRNDEIDNHLRYLCDRLVSEFGNEAILERLAMVIEKYLNE